MTPYSLISILISFFFTLYIIPKWIFRANKANLTGKDLHKDNQKNVPEIGGLPVLMGFLAGILVYIAFNIFVYQQTRLLYILFAAITSLLIAAFIGIVDDILGWKIGLRQFQKALLTFGIALPIMVINAGSSIVNLPFFGAIDFGLWYPLLIIPLGIMFTSNAFNMVAGYNGLEAGMGIIILFTLSLISFISGSYWVSVLGLCMVSALFGFFIYNRYPAKLFPGDTLTYAVGALIGIMAVLANIEKFAIALFVLYIVQFFLKSRGLMQKESFARVAKDGSLIQPYSKFYGIEHIVIAILRMTKKKAYEKDVVGFILAVQTIIALLVVAYFFMIR